MRLLRPLLPGLLGVCLGAPTARAQAVAEKTLTDDALRGQSRGTSQGAGEFLPDGGWRSRGGRLVYDAGEVIENGAVEITMRGVALPATGAAKSNVLTAWESGEPFKSGKEPGAFWMLRIGTTCHLKALAASDGSDTRYEADLHPPQPVRGEAHRYRIEWANGVVKYFLDGAPLYEHTFSRMAVRYFVLGLDNSFSANALTDPAPILSDLKLVNRGAVMPISPAASETVARYAIFEKTFAASGRHANPYRDVTATVTFRRHMGATKTLPLFFTGKNTYAFRFSPDSPGRWDWKIDSNDPALNGQTGAFACAPSDLRGGLVVKGNASTRSLTYENGAEYWLFGDTNWAAFAAERAENLSRQTVTRYAEVRAGQGFNFLQTALLTGRPNEGGAPFLDLAGEIPNEAYWREVDARVRMFNGRGITPLLTLAWGAKKAPLFTQTWAEFPSDAARLRFARYAVARYSAYDVAFALAGEWNRADASPARVALMKKLGETVAAADPHDRWITLTADPAKDGSVARFAAEPWAAFHDFRTSPRDRYASQFKGSFPEKITVQAGLPVVGGNASPEALRHAVYDALMAGNYLVTAFAGSQFGGFDQPGPFDPAAGTEGLRALQLAKTLFLDEVPRGNGRGGWNWIRPFRPGTFRGDTLLVAPVARSADGPDETPPAHQYAVLAKEGKGFTAVVYVRGHAGTYRLKPLHDPLDPARKTAQRTHTVHRFDPRTGEYVLLDTLTGEAPTIALTPSDAQDWVFVVRRLNIFEPDLTAATGKP